MDEGIENTSPTKATEPQSQIRISPNLGSSSMESRLSKEFEELKELNLDRENEHEQLVQEENEINRANRMVDDKRKLQEYVMNTVNYQDRNHELVRFDLDFYNNVQKYVNLEKRLTKRFWYTTESVIDTRLQKMLTHAHTFSSDVFDKLTSEEQEAYQTICECMKTLRENLQDKIKSRLGNNTSTAGVEPAAGTGIPS